MTLYDWAKQRRLNWKAEGHAEGLRAGYAEGLREGQSEGREEILRASIAKILADDALTPEQKNHIIAILNDM